MKEIDEAAVRRAAEETWAVMPGIRAEFTSKENFIAYRVAMAQGRIKVYGTRDDKPAR